MLIHGIGNNSVNYIRYGKTIECHGVHYEGVALSNFIVNIVYFFGRFNRIVEAMSASF